MSDLEDTQAEEEPPASTAQPVPGRKQDFPRSRSCVCAAPECLRLARQMWVLDLRRVGWVKLPLYHSPEEVAQAPAGGGVRKMAHRRARYLHYLGPAAQAAASAPPNPKTVFHVSLLHFHPGFVIPFSVRGGTGQPFPTCITMNDCMDIAGSLEDKIPGVSTIGRRVVPNPFLLVPTYSLSKVATQVVEQQYVKAATASYLSIVHTPFQRIMPPAVSNRPPVPVDEEDDLDEDPYLPRLSSISPRFSDLSSTGSGSGGSSIGNMVSQVAEVAHLREQNAELLRRAFNKDPLVERLEAENSQLRQDMLGQLGYVTRSSLMNTEWHQRNPKAANSYFGFASWAETKYTLWALFGVKNLHEGQLHVDSKADITPFESYLIAKMRFKSEFTYQLLAHMFGKSPEHIGRLVNFRAREWGEGGMDLNILDITKEYIDIEMPQEYIDTGFSDVGILVDGKDNNTDTYRLDSALSRAQRSSKKHTSACRTMGYLTPAGLTVEHTPAYWARASETALEALWGSHRGLTPDREVDELGEPLSMLPLSRRVRYNVPAHNRARDVRRQESIQRRIQSLPASVAQEEEDDLQSDAGLDEGDITEAPQTEGTQTLQARFLTQLGGLDLEDIAELTRWLPLQLVALPL
ncbi:hypothetical protein B484DRAFT_400656 [Ochromonadaceae sp. CCMP2298]|nr:hypothetical protein B484DRAFT_400656 [Ochromonadaceae sp. CCMP2298]